MRVTITQQGVRGTVKVIRMPLRGLERRSVESESGGCRWALEQVGNMLGTSD